MTPEEAAAVEAPLATLDRHASAAPASTYVIRKWWHEAEALAEVPPVKGRATYGPRRRAVDEAKRLALGGCAECMCCTDLVGWAWVELNYRPHAYQAWLSEPMA